MATALMNMSLPVVGLSGTLGPTWATMLNAALEVIDSHDHTETKGKKIPVSGLNLNANMDLNGYDMIGLRSVKLQSQSALFSLAADVLSVYIKDNELIYRNAAGTNVQITSGGGLNLASLGTISGDYSTSTADLTYSNTAKAYTFLQSAGVTAYINSGAISIFENVASAKYTRLKTPAGQAGNLEITLPASLSSTVTLPLVGTTAGILSFAQVVTAMIADAQVTTAKVVDLNITTGKLADLAVTTAKIDALAVTNAKIAATTITNDKFAIQPRWYHTEFTANGNMVIPTDCAFIEVEGCGGGGGAGTTGGGGGAGAPIHTGIYAVTPGATYAVTIGAGGIGGGRAGNLGEVAGLAGSDTIIAAVVTIKGGLGGGTGFGGGGATAGAIPRALGTYGGNAAQAGQGSALYAGGAAGEGGGGGAGPYGAGAAGNTGGNAQGGDASANTGAGGGSGGGSSSNGGHGGSGRLRIKYVKSS